MNAEEAKAAIYEMKPVQCTAAEWERDVKNGLLDYVDRLEDVGDTARLTHCQAEFFRLDKTYGKEEAKTAH